MADYSNLELNFLGYAYQCVIAGRTAELEAIGIDVEDMRLIRQLPLSLIHI